MGQHLHAPLHGGVGGVARHGEAGEAGGEVEDAPAVLDERQQRLGQEEGALEVDVEQGVELLLRGLLEAGVNADAGVVDQKVEAGALPLPGEQPGHFFGEGGKGGALAHVQGQGMGLYAEGTGTGHHRLGLPGLAAVGNDEIDAFGREGQGAVFAKATAGPCDEGNGSGHGVTPVRVADTGSV